MLLIVHAAETLENLIWRRLLTNKLPFGLGDQPDSFPSQTWSDHFESSGEATLRYFFSFPDGMFVSINVINSDEVNSIL